MVHRQADNFVGYLGSHWQVLGCSTWQSTIGAEGADEREEVTTAQHVLFFHLEVELVAGLAVLLCVDEDGEIAVVMTHAGHIVEETDAGDVAQGFEILDGHLMALLDGCIHLLEVQQSVGSTNLVHLAIDTRSHNLGLSGKAKVLEVVDALLGLLVVHHEGSAFEGVIDLGSVEAEGGHVASCQNALAIDLDTKGMGRIVDDLQAILVGDGLDGIHIHRLAVAVHGHNGSGLGRDGGLNLLRVYAAGLLLNIHEHGTTAVPPDAVGGGHKTVGRGDDFARDTERLQGCQQRQGAVGEQADVRHFQVLGQCLLQLLVELPVVRNPLTRPNLLEHLIKLVEVGKQRRGDGYFIHYRLIFDIY